MLTLKWKEIQLTGNLIPITKASAVCFGNQMIMTHGEVPDPKNTMVRIQVNDQVAKIDLVDFTMSTMKSTLVKGGHIPIATDQCQHAFWKKFIILIKGGQTRKGFSQFRQYQPPCEYIYLYDLEENVWDMIGPINSDISGRGVCPVVLNDELFVIGTNNVIRVDLIMKTHKVIELTYPRGYDPLWTFTLAGFTHVVVLNGRIIGITVFLSGATFFEYDPTHHSIRFLPRNNQHGNLILNKNFSLHADQPRNCIILFGKISHILGSPARIVDIVVNEFPSINRVINVYRLLYHSKFLNVVCKFE